jgi:hypothetical protein
VFALRKAIFGRVDSDARAFFFFKWCLESEKFDTGDERLSFFCGGCDFFFSGFAIGLDLGGMILGNGPNTIERVIIFVCMGRLDDFT